MSEDVLDEVAKAIKHNLNEDDADQFDIDYYRAKENCADLRLVWPKFAVWILVDPEDGVIKYNDCKDVKDDVKDVAGLYQRVIDGEEVPVEQFRLSVDSAYASYANYVTHASYTAYAAAYVRGYADATAASSATLAATDAAENKTEHVLKQRDQFLKLLRECK